MKRKKKSVQYAVFAMTLKRSFVRKKRDNNPDYPNYRILVKERSKYEKALKVVNKEQGAALGIKRRRKNFNRIDTDIKAQFYTSRSEAFEGAYTLLDDLKQIKKRARLQKDSENDNYRLYCVRLKPDVWKFRRFKKANPLLVKANVPSKLQGIPAYYVGQTGKTIKGRYKSHQVHTKGQNDTTTEWGKKYFVVPFEKAFDEKLLKEFHHETGIQIKGLKCGWSIVYEAKFAEWIRSKGMGAFFG